MWNVSKVGVEDGERIENGMIDEKKLIEEFRKTSDRYWYTPWIVDVINEQPKVNYPLSYCVRDCKSCWKTKLANPKWIPCSERLPEESFDSVMGWDTYRKRCVFVQYYCGRWILGDDESVNIVTWQPLPEPYKINKTD